MKQLRIFFLLIIALLANSTMYAQYLNIFGLEQGSVPLEKLKKVEFSSNGNGNYQLKLISDQTEGSILNPSSVDSLTITDMPYFHLPVSLERAELRFVDGQQTQYVRMTPAWGYQGLYHAIVYMRNGGSDFEYCIDGNNWEKIYDTSYYVAGEGWCLLTLDLRTFNYLMSSTPFQCNVSRSSLAKSGFVLIKGDVVGQNDAQRLSMPVNEDGWWASPRFVADGELRPYFKTVYGTNEFTIYDGHIYQQDCDIPTSWLDAKGAAYSVQGKVGQKLYINIESGEALVSTPDEVPFPLENPIFRTSNTYPVSSDDPTLCVLTGDNGNTVVLRWDAVDGASGYRIKMALQNKVSEGGSVVWDNPDNLLMDQTVDADVTSLSIPNLNYGTNYRFAIQALSPRGEKFNSAWFGYGGPRYWYAYLSMSTSYRYAVPNVVNVSQVTKSSMRVHITPDLNNYSTDVLEEFAKHFNINNNKVRVDYLTVEASEDTPNAVVPEKYAHYVLTTTDIERGYVDIDGLSENSTYIIRVWDATISAPVDAYYNTVIRSTKGIPGAPILLLHSDLMTKYQSDNTRAAVYALATEYDAAPLSPVLADFMTSTKLAEGQTFYLEGGKTYYLDGQDEIYKGFVLATNPDDVANGKRAKVICGIGRGDIFSSATNGEQWQGPYADFMLGRLGQVNEEGELEIEKIAFHNIDFDNPKALNYGDYVAGLGNATANYFFNMYSNGLGMVLNQLTFDNCTFKRFVRGFIREQGFNRKIWNHVLMKDNQFYDCGYYNQGAGGYGLIADACTNAGSNLYKDFQMLGNTFYDSPFPALFNQTRNTDWEDTGGWNITFSNNTLVNLNTRANGAIFKMRNLPQGSVYTVQNNLIVLCKQPSDQRVLRMFGADIRGALGKVTLNFSNNWSTNNDLTNGSIFSANSWTASSNSFQNLVNGGNATLNGTLDVQVADISAIELMESPCPPHVAQSDSDQNMHRADALDGTATTNYNVNLYFKDTNNDIYRNNVGASRWHR